jgi:protease-4
MKKFLIGVVAGLLLAGLAGVIVIFALLRLGSAKPSIPESAAMVLRLEGALPERAPLEIPLPWAESSSPATVVELWGLLNRAGKDERVKAIFLQPRGLMAGWAKLQEIHAALEEFKKSGKPVVAYLRNPGAREYYLATAADAVYMSREDLLDLKGLRAEFLFFRKALDKFGIQLEVERQGRYKDAADAFTRTSLAPESREAMDAVLDQIYGDMVRRISAGRRMAPEAVSALLDDGPFLAKPAEKHGFVDGLKFEDEAFDELNNRVKEQNLARISHRDYLRMMRESFPRGRRARIAFITGEGTILRGEEAHFGDGSALWSGSFSKLLDQVARDQTIKGAILRIDSPGGDAAASDEILHAARRLSRKKPLVISMSDVAASGGYYIAMTGDPVIAWPNTITGSIGVIYGKLNLAGLYGKIGIDSEILKRGRNAAIDSEIQPLSASGREKLKEGIASAYDSFLERVAEGRKRDKSEIESLAQGRVWVGSDAKHKGLVDELGGLERALSLVRERAGIAAADQVEIVVYPRRKNILEQLFAASGELAQSGETAFARDLQKEVQETLGVDWRLLREGGLMRIAPFSIRVQ